MNDFWRHASPLNSDTILGSGASALEVAVDLRNHHADLERNLQRHAGKARLNFVGIARESRSDGSCFGYLVHATWGHSAIHGILHGILRWYCPNCHRKMEKLALL